MKPILFTGVCLLLFAQTLFSAPNTQLPVVEMEKASDPPAFVWATGSSEAMISTHGPFVSYQVNVDENGQNITGDAANEPSIAVDPTDHNKMAIGWRQFDSVRSNFRQAGHGYTSNGGLSWTFPGVLQPNVFRSDPVLNSDDAGHFFYLSLLQNFFDDLWRSDNGGANFNYLAPARGGDKQWFTIDKTNSSGHGFQYQCWSTAGNNYGGRQFTRSTDGGFTWLDPVNIPNSPFWGTLDVDSNGTLFVAGVTGSNRIWCERSTSARNAAVVPAFDLSTPVNLGGTVVFSPSINPEGLLGQVFVAVDRSGTSTNNNVYLLASLQTTGSGSDVMFVRSTDAGQTFSAPIRINDDGGGSGRWHWFGALAVAPNGRLDAVWYDTRNSANNTDSQLMYSYSTDGGVTWSRNVEVSGAFNPHVGYPNQNKLGDYITLVSDNTGADVAYSATFNGEEDIYYVRVFPQLHLLNISTRGTVAPGEDNLIGGFIATGTDTKKVMVRGLGPSLSASGVANALQDPVLELHDGSGNLIVTNDNWQDSQAAEIAATGIAPTDPRESAIVRDVAPGSYTAVLRGQADSSGVGLVEVYDLAPSANSQLANISTRGLVQTDTNVMIGGLIVGGATAPNGTGAARVVIRAIGPSLAQLGVTNALADPTVELHDSNGMVLLFDDNWQDNQQTEIQATGLAPSDDRESALVTLLSAGNYTAVVRGKSNSTGLALVEAYNLP